MATKRKAGTKKDLEDKIAQLEAKLNKLSTQLEAKPAETKPAEVKPAETKPAEVKPAETKPAEVKPAETKPKGVLPKGSTPKPSEVPKPAKTEASPPATYQEALENAYYNAPQTDFHQYRAKVTGYAPAPNRYFVRLTAPVGKVPTSDWNQQKSKVPGYTQPSNQYFATRARMAYSPPGKTFGSFSGVYMTVEGLSAQVQTEIAPPPPKPDAVLPKGTLPKGTTQVSTTSSSGTKSDLEAYEDDYLARLDSDAKADAEFAAAAEELAAKRRAESSSSSDSSGSKKGALPKGF